MNGFRWSVALPLAYTFCAFLIGTGPVIAASTTEAFQGRDMIIYVPDHLAATDSRSLVVVLHGGLGNAALIESGHGEAGLGMDAQAQMNGFIVLYLNGTRAARAFGSSRFAWNAGGGCCGLPALSDVDDVHYIESATRSVASRYAVAPNRLFVMGHSNGAMMAQRLMCESSEFAAAVSVSGPLNLPVASCPAAAGKRLLAIHGSDDENVPVGGGQGTKGVAGVSFLSEENGQRVFTNSGAQYRLELVAGAPHKLEAIDAAAQRLGSGSIAQQSVDFFNIARR